MEFPGKTLSRPGEDRAPSPPAPPAASRGSPSAPGQPVLPPLPHHPRERRIRPLGSAVPHAAITDAVASGYPQENDLRHRHAH